MAALEFEGVEVDCCLKCGGAWLDAGELCAFLPGGSEDRFLAGLGGGRAEKRRCPLCRRHMELVSDPVSGARLDRCPAGCGTWFDSGELKTVLCSADPALEGSPVIRLLRDIFATAQKQGG